MRLCWSVIIFGLFLCVVASNSIHGGTLIAMAGYDSVILAADTRFSSYQSGSFLLGEYPRKIFRVGANIIVGCFGLDADALSLKDHVQTLFSETSLKHIEPQSVARVISDFLYSKPLICSPIVVGFSSHDWKPYICCMDGIGAQTVTSDFALVGTASTGLYAICENLYNPGLSASELVSTVESCLKSALERDVLSGCKARIFTLTKDGIFAKDFMTSDV